jgi:hypothetical protein
MASLSILVVMMNRWRHTRIFRLSNRSMSPILDNNCIKIPGPILYCLPVTLVTRALVSIRVLE